MGILRGAAVNMATAMKAFAVHIYVSEGRNKAFVSKLSAAGTAAGVTVANEFMDAAYHRAGITLASSSSDQMKAAVVAVCQEALSTLDLRHHTASHPRIGVVDHVACNPLGAATCEEAGRLAASLGHDLGAGGAEQPAIPVYLYGAASAKGRPLADLRRSLGYFAGAARGEWSGLSPTMASALKDNLPDVGPSDVDLRYGAVAVGAVPWVHNFNLLVTAGSLDSKELMARCRRIARSISTRGGGLPAVETMALPHERGVEVACNLLDVTITSPGVVRDNVAKLCETEGVTLDSDYFTNKQPDEILAMIENQ